jgi:hypothetical protein
MKVQLKHKEKANLKSKEIKKHFYYRKKLAEMVVFLQKYLLQLGKKEIKKLLQPA